MSKPESVENGTDIVPKKIRKPRSRKTEKLNIDDPTYRITFTPAWREKQILKKMITGGVAKNITDAVCECIRRFEMPDVPTPEEAQKQSK